MSSGRDGEVRGPGRGGTSDQDATPPTTRLFRLFFVGKARSPNAWKVATCARLQGRRHPVQLHLGYVPRQRQELTAGDRRKLLGRLRTRVAAEGLMSVRHEVDIAWEDADGKLRTAHARTIVEVGRSFPPAAPSAALSTPVPRSAATALSVILREHLPLLKHRALTLTRGNAAEAKDLVQDTIERMLRSEVEPAQLSAPWLLSVLNHLFIDRARRQARVVSLDPDHVAALAAPPHLPSDDAPHERWHDFTSDDVVAALDRLSTPIRIVWQLHMEQHLSYTEISARLGLPVATVGTRLLRARRLLREILLTPKSDGSST